MPSQGQSVHRETHFEEASVESGNITQTQNFLGLTDFRSADSKRTNWNRWNTGDWPGRMIASHYFPHQALELSARENRSIWVVERAEDEMECFVSRCRSGAYAGEGGLARSRTAGLTHLFWSIICIQSPWAYPLLSWSVETYISIINRGNWGTDGDSGRRKPTPGIARRISEPKKLHQSLRVP